MEGERGFYRLGVILMIVGVLHWAQVVFIPLALAVLFAFALTPVAGWLERKGLGRTVGALLVSVAALGLLAGLGWVAGNQLQHLASEMQGNQDWQRAWRLEGLLGIGSGVNVVCRFKRKPMRSRETTE